MATNPKSTKNKITEKRKRHVIHSPKECVVYEKVLTDKLILRKDHFLDDLSIIDICTSIKHIENDLVNNYTNEFNAKVQEDRRTGYICKEEPVVIFQRCYYAKLEEIRLANFMVEHIRYPLFEEVKELVPELDNQALTFEELHKKDIMTPEGLNAADAINFFRLSLREAAKNVPFTWIIMDVFISIRVKGEYSRKKEIFICE